jgi:hypothetical protein
LPTILLWAMVLGGAALALWSVAVAGLVVWRAETLAQGQPYCIQVASQTDGSAYEAAATLWDLTRWKMHAHLRGGEGSNSFLFHHHALLLVDTGTMTFRNWSYWKETFVDEVMERHLNRHPPVQCVPEQHFARHLPFFLADTERKSVLRLGDRTYAVPQPYRPRLQTDVLGTPRLVLTAVAPAFEPFRSPVAQRRSMFCYDVMLRPEAGRSLESIANWKIDAPNAEIAGEEFGLTELVIAIVDKSVPAGKRSASSLHYAKSDAGRITTLIRCDLLFKADPCWHHFVRDGLVYSFHHERDRLADWAAMQETLAGLIASFVTEAPAPSTRAPETGAPSARVPPVRQHATRAVQPHEAEPAVPDLPAAGSEVHAVGVHEGTLPGGRRREFMERAMGTVDVHVALRDRPVTLVLAAYQPVRWQITLAPGVRLAQVLARGHDTPEVSGVPEGVPVLASSDARDPGALRLWGKASDQVLDFAERVQAATGGKLRTVQHEYQGKRFVVDGQRSLPIPGAAGPQGIPLDRAPRGPVTFQKAPYAGAPPSPGSLTPDGLTASYCCAGSFSLVTADRAYTAGKHYVEFTLRVRPGTAAPGQNTNVGLVTPTISSGYWGNSEGGYAYPVLAPTALGRLRDGDVVGMAMDLDTAHLYHHVNGTWGAGPPPQAGVAIKPGREYRVAVTVTPDFLNPKQPSDGWTANFGHAPFAFPTPRGFQPYGGPATGR